MCRLREGQTSTRSVSQNSSGRSRWFSLRWPGKSGGPTLGAERGRRDAVLFEKGKSSGQGISGHRMSPVRSHFGSGKSGGPIWGAERGKRDAVLSEKGKSSGQAPLAKYKRYRGREKWRTYFGGRKGRLLPEKGRSSGQGIAGRSESPVL